MRPPRSYKPLLITPDTNVLVSGTTLSQTPPAQIVQAWQEEQVEFALSEPILQEMHAVLSQPYHRDRTGWSVKQVDEYVQTLREGALLVPGTTSVKVSPDPDDDKFFACAIEAQADYLVSGDKRHILSVGTYRGVKTISPRAFVNDVLPLHKAA